MIDCRGAIVSGDPRSGYVTLRTPGFVDPKNYSLLPGARWSDRQRSWQLPSNVVDWHDTTLATQPRKTPSGLVLREYQNTAVEFLNRAFEGAILALDVGLGKTVCALNSALEFRHLTFEQQSPRPILIAAPQQSSRVWVSDRGDPIKHFGFSVGVLSGKTPDMDTIKEGRTAILSPM